MLAACSRPGVNAMVPVTAQAPGATEHTILIATTRTRSSVPGAMFSGERARELDYAQAVVSVPPTHVPSRIEWPSQPPGNPQTDFVTRESVYLDSEKEFVASLNQQLAQRPTGQRTVVLFVHGYNTLFPEGLYRLAQVAHDANAQGVPVYFSWASRGELLGYVYDQNSATAARDGLEHLLMLIARSNAEKVNIIAHSMGNWVTVEAFRGIKISGEARSIAPKLGQSCWRRPISISTCSFADVADAFRKSRSWWYFRATIAPWRRARLIAGNEQRLGDYKNAADLTKYGAVVVDLSDLKGQDSFNHDKFAELAQMAPQLKEVLAQGVGHKEAVDEVDPMQNAPGVVQTVLTLPFAVVAAPIVIIWRAGQ